MKIQRMLFIVFFAILICQNSYSQQDSVSKKIIFRNDTLIFGKYYSFYMKMNESLMGKLISLSENKFIVYADKDMEEIDTGKIINILDPGSYLFGEYHARKYEGKNAVYFYFGAGYTITRPGVNIDQRNKNGFNLSANSLFTFSKYFGIRTDLDYYHFEREDYTYSYNYLSSYYSYSYTGGASNCFLVKANLVFGSLNPDGPVQIYFMPALGTGLTFKTPRKYTSYSSSYSYYTENYGNDETSFSIGVSIGAGFNLKFSKKIRGFAEYQYNLWYLGEGSPPGFNTIKLGIILNGK